MAYEFRLPDIGEGVAEGEITKWFVKPGDVVKEDQPLCEVMTDKATVEVPSPVAGKVLELRAKVGQKVPVESVLVVLEAGSASAPKAHGHAPAHAAAPAASKATAAGRPSAPPPVAAPAALAVEPTPMRVLAAPATRKLAREMGIDIRRVPGSGPHGRITKDDVRNFSGAGATVAPVNGGRAVEVRPGEYAPGAARSIPAPMPSGPREERIPMVGLRRKIAEQMRKSKDSAAHFTYVDEVDVTELVLLRQEAKARGAALGLSVTYLPFIMKALVEGFRKFPALNATYDEAKGEIIIKRYYNFGIAVDTDRGLVVPVVKDVDRKSIYDLARDIQAISEKTRNNKIAIEDLRDGTFTITNAGNIGGLFATPVINIPEVAILGVHKIAKKPVVRDNQVVIRDIMYLSISIDHRIVDGATGARFMNEVIRLLEKPSLLFLGNP